MAFALSMVTTGSRRRVCTDRALLAAAAEVRELHKARQILRRVRGREPPVLDAVAYAAQCEGSIDPDLNKWRHAFAARNEVTLRWMWLVVATARKIYAQYLRSAPGPVPSLSLADMVQEGVCGLMTGVERWRPDRECPFEPYAFFAIKHAILRAVENQGRTVRLPVHVHSKLSRLRKARVKLEAQHSGQRPAIEQVANDAGMSVEEACLYLNRSRSIRSLDAPLPQRWAHEDKRTLREFLVDHTVDVNRQLEVSWAREALTHVLHSANLNHLELSVLLLKYGLADGIERQHADVGRVLNVHKSTVRRAELRALDKLRKHLDDDASNWAELLS